MSSSVLVVVIVGCIVVVVARLTIAEEAPKPATPPDPSHRAAPDPEAKVREGDERVPAFTDAPAAQHLTTEPLEPLAPSWGQRIRAALLLGVTVLVLGSAAAGLLGGALYLGLRALDRALG